jgi:hypothetical protein
LFGRHAEFRSILETCVDEVLQTKLSSKFTKADTPVYFSQFSDCKSIGVDKDAIDVFKRLVKCDLSQEFPSNIVPLMCFANTLAFLEEFLVKHAHAILIIKCQILPLS